MSMGFQNNNIIPTDLKNKKKKNKQLERILKIEEEIKKLKEKIKTETK